MFKYFKYFFIYFEFIEYQKKINNYEFSLNTFVKYSNIDNQIARRILNNIVKFGKLEKKYYHKSNKIKYLIK